MACNRVTEPHDGTSRQVQTPAPTLPVRVQRPTPIAEFNCEELRPLQTAEARSRAEIIGLRPPPIGKKIVISKVGVIVTFDRGEFLKAARCLQFEKAVAYVERETGFTEESPIMDAFQSSYVAAALLDAGRAGVRKSDEAKSRPAIVRDPWTADGCNGHCRSSGRLYRLSEDDAGFFLRITDATKDL
jgi:hypothetical protein